MMRRRHLLTHLAGVAACGFAIFAGALAVSRGAAPSTTPATQPAAVLFNTSREPAPATTRASTRNVQATRRAATHASDAKSQATTGARPRAATVAAVGGEPQSRPVPLLSPEDAARTFNLPPGFRAEVVAAEPQVQHPVAMEIDPDGRLWVVEMRGYMPDPHGKGEDRPLGRVVTLEDTDGDGRMDRHTVFLDGLVMPRAIGLSHGGVLVAVPPRLLFCRDTDGDGKSDEQTLVRDDYGLRGNPEHMANGLLRGIDNWIYSANYNRRLRYQDGNWITSPVPELGQWGISQDDAGRLYHDSNSDYLRASLIPPHYAVRNPNWAVSADDFQIDRDQNCWPAHASAVNRGYREGFLRDGRLARFTAACAPLVYRGDLLGPEFAGNAFVCEPSANLVRRSIVMEQPDGTLAGRNAHERKEFLASTYERFRPVNLYNSPEGALYVVDMHHGLIQHVEYLTDYARKLYLDRQLDKHLQTGRIYRIVPEGAALPTARPRLSKATAPQLVRQLSHPNGWWRDTAQRLLVERRDADAVPLLREMTKSHAFALARLHALWALEGMGQLDTDTASAALKDRSPRVRAAAVRAVEPLALASDAEVPAASVMKLADDPDIAVRTQFVLSSAAKASPEAEDAVARVLRDSGDNFVLRDAALSGMRGREFDFVARVLTDPHWTDAQPGRAEVITDFSRAIVKSGDARMVGGLLDLMAQQQGPAQQWRLMAILEAVPEEPTGRPRRGAVPPKKVALDARPAALDVLASSATTQAARSRIARLESLLTWPGKSEEPAPSVPPLTPEQQALFDMGKQQYAAICGQCHKADGLGQAGLAPPLVNSEWVLGPESRLVRIVLHGLRGPVEIRGQTYNLDMPSLRALDDEKIAAALTYVRREWGHTAGPVDPKLVKDIRGATETRREAWSVQELQAVR